MGDFDSILDGLKSFLGDYGAPIALGSQVLGTALTSRAVKKNNQAAQDLARQQHEIRTKAQQDRQRKDLRHAGPVHSGQGRADACIDLAIQPDLGPVCEIHRRRGEWCYRATRGVRGSAIPHAADLRLGQ